jgi:hypothetical protein
MHRSQHPGRSQAFFGVTAVPRIGPVGANGRALGVGCLVFWAGARREMFGVVHDGGFGGSMRHVHRPSAISGPGMNVGRSAGCHARAFEAVPQTRRVAVRQQPKRARRRRVRWWNRCGLGSSGVKAVRSAGGQASRGNRERQPNYWLKPTVGDGLAAGACPRLPTAA